MQKYCSTPTTQIFILVYEIAPFQKLLVYQLFLHLEGQNLIQKKFDF